MGTKTVKTTVRKSGNSIVVRLPQDFRLPLGEATISRMGDCLVIHPAASDRYSAFMEKLQAIPDGLFDDLQEPEDKESDPIDTW